MKHVGKRGRSLKCVGEKSSPYEPPKKPRKTNAHYFDLTLGCDFAGMDTVRATLEYKLRLRVNQLFTSEINRSCRTLLSHTFPDVERQYTDIMLRDSELAPTVDLYTSGFPCQPFARGGTQLGLLDPRGKLWAVSLEYIALQAPKAVIMENVPGLLDKKFRYIFDEIIFVLEQCGYAVTWRILDTRNYGIPQTRLRLYLVGIKKTVQRVQFTFPEFDGLHAELNTLLGIPAETSMEHIERLLPTPGDARARKLVLKSLMAIATEGGTLTNNTVIVDVGCTDQFAYYKTNVFPCITARRGAAHDYWIVNAGRRVDVDELLALQGIPPGIYDYTAAGVSPQRMGHMAGNPLIIQTHV